MRRLIALLAVALLAVTFAACGGDDEAEPTGGDTTSSEEAPAVDNTDLTKEPLITVPPVAPPTELSTEDIVVGKGPKAKKGDKLSMQYVGVAYSTGQKFDASWDRGTPLDLTLGQGDVIKGWDQGLVGMQAGGRRLLQIPPDLAYGARGNQGIAPNETLIFIVDLVKIG